MKYALLIILLYCSLNLIGQKDFYKKEAKIHFQFHSSYPYLSEGITFFKGKPKKLDFEGMFYFNPGDFILLPENDYAKFPFVPASRYYFEESDLSLFPKEMLLKHHNLEKEYLVKRNIALKSEFKDGAYYAYLLSAKKLEKIFQPYYFKKHEVTNQEYWEFLKSVGATIDSTVYYKDLKYTFEFEGELIEINLYPDTSCWTNDWEYSYHEPFTRSYFTLSHYQEFPIVGINYYQAKAFCHWKTIQLQKSLTKGNKQIKIKVDLPSAVEWEWMALNSKQVNLIANNSLRDDSWMLDLVIDSSHAKKELNIQLSPSNYFRRAFPIDGSFYTHAADLENKSLHKTMIKAKKKYPHQVNYLDNLDENKISSLGDNLSEWLRDNYVDNWSFMFERQLKLWEQENTDESLLLRQIALYYDSKCDKDGYLVKGGNWFDERFSNVFGKNKAGIHAKTFVSPKKSHSTIGFRYVIHFIE